MGDSAQGPTIQLREEDRARVLGLLSEAQEALRRLAEGVIAAVEMEVPPSRQDGGTAADTAGGVTWVPSTVPDVVAAVIDLPTDPPSQAYVYYIDGEAVDVVSPATGPVFPH